ncbi:DUF5388 domain-containing protein, partial [Thomasclavelia cocleata]
MSLVQNNNKKTKVIPRGTDIKPQQQFSINDLEKNKETKKNTTSSTFKYTPTDTSIKVDTKIRDMINTLSLMGYGDNQKEVIQNALDHVLNDMAPETKRSFDTQYQVLENKTARILKIRTALFL